MNKEELKQKAQSLIDEYESKLSLKDKVAFAFIVKSLDYAPVSISEDIYGLDYERGMDVFIDGNTKETWTEHVYDTYYYTYGSPDEHITIRYKDLTFREIIINHIYNKGDKLDLDALVWFEYYDYDKIYSRHEVECWDEAFDVNRRKKGIAEDKDIEHAGEEKIKTKIAIKDDDDEVDRSWTYSIKLRDLLPYLHEDLYNKTDYNIPGSNDYDYGLLDDDEEFANLRIDLSYLDYESYIPLYLHLYDTGVLKREHTRLNLSEKEKEQTLNEILNAIKKDYKHLIEDNQDDQPTP